MFVDRLNTAQQGALLSIAAKLIAADGRISDQEAALLSTLRQQMAAGVSEAPINVSDLPSVFNTSRSKAAFVLELLGLAHADAEYHLTERDFISSVAQSLQVPATTLSDMESWVCRQFSLVREAEQFMEE